MRRISSTIGAGALLLALCGCQSVQHLPVIEPAPVVSQAEKDKDERALYLSVIDELIVSGEAHAALAHLDAFEQSFGTGPVPQRLRADAWLALGDMTKAEAGYRSVLNGAQSGYGKHGLGRIAAAQGNWALAHEQFEAASADQPTNPRFLNDLGCSLFHLGRLDDAEFTLRKAHELAPHDDEVTENILVLLAKSGGAARLDDIFSDISDDAERANLRARVLAYADDGGKGATP